MNREIKFRAWDAGTKTYLNDGFVIYPDGSIEFPEAGWDLSGHKEINIVLEQYTGLKDANGLEICEGDILVWAVNDVTRTASVVFEDGAYWMGNDSVSGFSVCNDWLRGEYTIIGNIHENPELLEA